MKSSYYNYNTFSLTMNEKFAMQNLLFTLSIIKVHLLGCIGIGASEECPYFPLQFLLTVT